MRATFLWFLMSGAVCAQQLSVDPANPTPLDLVRLRYTAAVCTNAESVAVSQQANRILVQTDRTFAVDCGTVAGFFDEYTLGRLPAGDYDAQLVINPPPGTLGPSQLVGPIHFTVVPLPPAASLSPHEDYSDIWWNPSEAGWALLAKQSGDKLVAMWVVYDTANRPAWYTLQPGGWRRDAGNVLRYSGIVYRTSGPFWGGPFNPAAVTVTAVGTAEFVPQTVSRAQFNYTIEGVTGSKQIERFRF
ncbi:MAG: hypothetical protein ACXWND_15700 [Gemmatimonadaceae bacterium]